MTDRPDLNTNLGVVRGGLPSDPERTDIALVFDEGNEVRIYAARVEVDPGNLGVKKSDRELEVVASFWMRTDYFLSTFGKVVADMERRRGQI